MKCKSKYLMDGKYYCRKHGGNPRHKEKEPIESSSPCAQAHKNNDSTNVNCYEPYSELDEILGL